MKTFNNKFQNFGLMTPVKVSTGGLPQLSSQNNYYVNDMHVGDAGIAA